MSMFLGRMGYTAVLSKEQETRLARILQRAVLVQVGHAQGPGRAGLPHSFLRRCGRRWAAGGRAAWA